MVNKNLSVFFSEEDCKIYRNKNCEANGQPIAHASCMGGLYGPVTGPSLVQKQNRKKNNRACSDIARCYGTF